MIGPHVTIEDAVAQCGPGPWWIAHEHPERPDDEWVLWSWSCDPCVLHLIAATRLDPHGSGCTFKEGRSTNDKTMSEALTACLVWREANGIVTPWMPR